MTEAALALSEQKVCSLGELLSSAKEEQTKLVENHTKEFQQYKKVDWGRSEESGSLYNRARNLALFETDVCA